MIGSRLGHYHLLEKIGAGGMGEVYRARDERLQRDVALALKVLPARTLASEDARRRFRREALALSKIDHPNIATVHGSAPLPGGGTAARRSWSWSSGLAVNLTLAFREDIGREPRQLAFAVEGLDRNGALRARMGDEP
jgi:serine/threonine protein kinase